jgi:succinoglycan biosynthesis transport protein ExoP
VTLVDLVRMTRANLRLIFIVFSMGLLAAFAWTLTRPVIYASTASGQIYVGSSVTVGEMQASMGLAQTKADVYSAYVGGSKVREKVAEALHISPGLVTLSGSSNVLTSQVTVTAYAATPEEAQALAAQGVRSTAEVALETENETLPQGSSTQSIVRLDPLEDASLPSAPFTPNYTRNLAVGALVGILLGYVAAFVRMNLDRKLRSVEEVEELIETPVLAILPDVKELDRKQGVGVDRSHRGPAAEAFRQLRTNFRFIDVDNPIRSVVITSANEGEGKSTVATNLARVLATAGQDTVLIDADLRRPVVAGIYGVDTQVGLAQVLVGDLTAEEALQESGIDHLKVMSAGRVPHNPSELLGSQRMQHLLQELSRDHMVILDAPPLLPVTDAALLAAVADGAMVVFAVGRTYKEQARLAKRRLEQTGGRMLGVILNRAPMRGMGAVVYGYGYGSYTTEYVSNPPEAESTPKRGQRKKQAMAKMHAGVFGWRRAKPVAAREK